ncbi:MAG TPA: low specificity L-threonine aldolase [Solirubrobacteraceae bacterium]|nr:low specificity L-threonine aldolase [Solirubrobacteraceae bacterium]
MSKAGSRGFASDNAATVHPAVLESIARANHGHAFGYGHDPYTESVQRRLAEKLGAPDAGVFFVFNGTGANVLCLRSALRPWQAAIVSEHAHLHTDEVGAPEAVGGFKLLPAVTVEGKLTLEGVARLIEKPNDEHFVKPGLLSITQSTELGTLYQLDELRALIDLAHGGGLLVHIDGSRIANAAAALGVGLDEVVRGVDILSFGGTKNGLLGAEAVVVFNPDLAEGMLHLRKQTLQLASKMRFLAAQFDALLEDDLWLQNASHANAMALRLADAVGFVDGVTISRKPAVNAVFATLPRAARDALLEQFDFYEWDETTGEVRWMCSWDTTEEDIDTFAAAVRAALA